MALNLAALTTSPGLPGAADAPYPETVAACAAAWADAMAAYVTGIVPPILPPVVNAAKATLSTALLAAFQAESGVAALMDTAFTAFATAIGGGMVGYVPTPPALPVNFAALFTPPFPASRAAGALKIATRIDTWMRTGSSALSVTPFTVVTWS